jgi:hypothetical protein
MDSGKVIRALSAAQAVGWRVWTVQERPEGVRLGSVVHDAVWTPAKLARAACSVDTQHAAPGIECNCGFHAARDPVDAFSYLHGRNEPRTIARVLGEVMLSGSIVEMLCGWRASQAYPLRLYVRDPELALALAGYGVPVLSAMCESVTATSSRRDSAGSRRNSWSAARTRSSRTAVSG